MRFAFLYFSGTGNSLRILGYAKKEFESHGHEVVIFNVEKEEYPDYSNIDGIGFFYPIYAFNCPKPMIQYVKKMGKSEKRISCFVMKNSGEHLFWNNASSLRLSSMLKKRNLFIENEYHYLMPYSFMFRHTEEMAFRMDEEAKRRIPLDTLEILQNKKRPIKRYFLDRPFAAILRIQWFGGRFNGRFYKVKENECIHCHKCINACPAHNITYADGKFHFGGQCYMCERCVFHCPKGCIEPGLFRSWKVNGVYSFSPKEGEKDRHPHYWKKNYEKYFRGDI